MSYNNISAVLSATDLQDIKDAIVTIKSKMPFLVGLDESERKKLRKLGPLREGYHTKVNSALHANPDIVPTSFGIAEYDKDINLRIPVNEIYNLIYPLFTGVSDTRMALGNEVIKRTDQGYELIKTAARNGNTNLTDILAEIKAILKQKPKPPAPPPVNP